ncbi:MAG: hypothetical protein AB7T32_00675 [Dehalococcoidia bacterium]
MPKRPPRPKEPFILWWMPIVAILAPVIWAAWVGASSDADGLKDALMALLWPGVALYAGALALLWGGWKIELE